MSFIQWGTTDPLQTSAAGVQSYKVLSGCVFVVLYQRINSCLLFQLRDKKQQYTGTSSLLFYTKDFADPQNTCIFIALSLSLA